MDDRRRQNQDSRPFSNQLTPILVAKYRLQWHLEKDGWLPTFERVLFLLASKTLRFLGVKEKVAERQAPISPDEV
ncbi:MAG: hypothetical protein ABSE93_11565 [Terriglobia bacterium]|jgi:hypothetical protein